MAVALKQNEVEPDFGELGKLCICHAGRGKNSISNLLDGDFTKFLQLPGTRPLVLAQGKLAGEQCRLGTSLVMQRGLGASATWPFSSRGLCRAILSAVPSQWWLLPAHLPVLHPCVPVSLHFGSIGCGPSEEGRCGNMAPGMWGEDSRRRNCGRVGGVPWAAQGFISFTSLSVPRKSCLRTSARTAAMLRFLFGPTMPRAP